MRELYELKRKKTVPDKIGEKVKHVLWLVVSFTAGGVSGHNLDTNAIMEFVKNYIGG